MTSSTKQNWRRKLTLAAVTGLIAGAARAITTYLLNHFTSGS
jgi:hypothetical protein